MLIIEQRMSELVDRAQTMSLLSMSAKKTGGSPAYIGPIFSSSTSETLLAHEGKVLQFGNHLKGMSSYTTRTTCRF